MSKTTSPGVRRAKQLVDRIRPLFAGYPPEIISIVLADLLATLLAGHICLDDQEETDKLREEILAMHLKLVRKLVPENEKEIASRQAGWATKQ